LGERLENSPEASPTLTKAVLRATARVKLRPTTLKSGTLLLISCTYGLQWKNASVALLNSCLAVSSQACVRMGQYNQPSHGARESAASLQRTSQQLSRLSYGFDPPHAEKRAWVPLVRNHDLLQDS